MELEKLRGIQEDKIITVRYPDEFIGSLSEEVLIMRKLLGTREEGCNRYDYFFTDKENEKMWRKFSIKTLLSEYDAINFPRSEIQEYERNFDWFRIREDKTTMLWRKGKDEGLIRGKILNGGYFTDNGYGRGPDVKGIILDWEVIGIKPPYAIDAVKEIKGSWTREMDRALNQHSIPILHYEEDVKVNECRERKIEKKKRLGEEKERRQKAELEEVYRKQDEEEKEWRETCLTKIPDRFMY